MIPLNKDQVQEFKKVLSQGSNFLSPNISKESISYNLEENFNSKPEAVKNLKKRINFFKECVRARTEITLLSDVKFKEEDGHE